MVRRLVVLAVVLATITPAGTAWAQVPLYEPGFLEPVPAGACAADLTNPYEAQGTHLDDYGAACKRMKFVFGPIHVRPGQNDALVEPVTIQKPAYDGYIVRFKPDLVDVSGTAPGIEEVHLHHGTWLNGNNDYGNAGIFFATGEEKTIATWPKGFGMRVQPSDVWLMLYMVHNATAVPRTVWLTYEIDFVKLDSAVGQTIIPTRPIWLDVGGGRLHDRNGNTYQGSPSNGGNPVFNVQRGFGHVENGNFVCTWPKENCANHNWLGYASPNQGITNGIDIVGKDWKVTADMAGTMIMMGGHVHPGGIRDEVGLVRGGVEKPIHISDAYYWGRSDPSLPGGPANTWDFSMTGTSADLGWRVEIKPGDKIRLNAAYDSQFASWYENMGIVMAWVADGRYDLGGIDVFDDPVTIDPGITVGERVRTANPPGVVSTCTPSSTTLCLRGQVTHGHMRESSRFGGCGTGPCATLPTLDGPRTSNISINGFTFGLADHGVIDVQGVPTVRLGDTVRFWNLDTFANVWHTVTRCQGPCTGATGLDYPLAGEGTGAMDFDSTEIGYSLFLGAASGQIGSSNKSPQESLQDGLFWDFAPTRTGDVSFFCRIHPLMRGSVRVVE